MENMLTHSMVKAGNQLVKYLLDAIETMGSRIQTLEYEYKRTSEQLGVARHEIETTKHMSNEWAAGGKKLEEAFERAQADAEHIGKLENELTTLLHPNSPANVNAREDRANLVAKVNMLVAERDELERRLSKALARAHKAKAKR